MAINQGANFNEVVVRFDSNSFGIQHIKVFENGMEQGTIDRKTSGATGLRPGVYHPDDPDIVNVVNRILARRGDPAQGAALFYRFDPGDDVDVTDMELATHPRYAFFMLMDPIHTEMRNRAGINPFAAITNSRPTGQYKGCLTGRIILHKD